MDPISIIGLTAAVQQILTGIYKFSQGIREARREINLLCSELLALRAALEHVQLNLQQDDKMQVDQPYGASAHLSSSNLSMPESHEMIESAQSLLSELLTQLEKPGKLNSALRRIAWPLKKENINSYVTRLERLKSFFILAITSDNR